MKNLKMSNQHIEYLEREADETTKSAFTQNMHLRSMNYPAGR